MHQPGGRIRHVDLLRDPTCAGWAVRAPSCEGTASDAVFGFVALVPSNPTSRGGSGRGGSQVVGALFVPKTILEGFGRDLLLEPMHRTTSPRLHHHP